jgi:hypothetical protein
MTRSAAKAELGRKNNIPAKTLRNTAIKCVIMKFFERYIIGTKYN